MSDFLQKINCLKESTIKEDSKVDERVKEEKQRTAEMVERKGPD